MLRLWFLGVFSLLGWIIGEVYLKIGCNGLVCILGLWKLKCDVNLILGLVIVMCRNFLCICGVWEIYNY